MNNYPDNSNSSNFQRQAPATFSSPPPVRSVVPPPFSPQRQAPVTFSSPSNQHKDSLLIGVVIVFIVLLILFIVSLIVVMQKKRPKEFLDKNGLSFRLVPSGSFMMGNTMPADETRAKYPPDGSVIDYEDATQHKVTISQPFYMSQYETTVGDFRKFVDATGYKTTAEKEGDAITIVLDKENSKSGIEEIDGLNWKNPGFEQTSKDPVVCISWEDCQAYLEWLNEKAEYEPELGFKPVYSLPTEAQWEYACRGGSKTEFCWGDEAKDGKGWVNGLDVSWLVFQMGLDESRIPLRELEKSIEEQGVGFPFKDRYITTAPVGSFKANAYGLYDMHGNVGEWCSDRYGDYPTESVTDPEGPSTGVYRIVRDGSWCNAVGSCRSAARLRADPSVRCDFLGFRVLVSSSK